MTDKVVKITPAYINNAKQTLSYLPDDKIREIAMYFATQFIEEISQGLEGEVEYKDAPFFEIVNEAYKKYAPQGGGCYFCDKDIDGNEIPFDPDTVHMCLSCQLKVANFMKAFNIDPGVLFPHIRNRKIQPVIFDPLHPDEMTRKKSEKVH